MTRRAVAWARHALRQRLELRDLHREVDELAAELHTRLHRTQAELDVALGFITLYGLRDDYELHAALRRRGDQARRPAHDHDIDRDDIGTGEDA